MRTVQIYIGRDYIDLDCVILTYVKDGNKFTVELTKDGILNDRNTYSYIIGNITITLYFNGTYWILYFNFNYGAEEYYYYSDTDVDYPVIKDWEYFDGLSLDFVGTQECIKLKYERIELFDDEKISVTSSVQNLSDLSKTFTDFSQSFTIPASIVNNRIFEHFYQNDVDGTIDHNIKRPAYIEIDFRPFRTGVISLDKSVVKNGLGDSYTISFYGNLTSLTNIFGDTKLNQLDFEPYSFPYTGTAVYDRVRDNTVDYDVRYPLIASDRLWSYGSLGTEDITQNSHAIQYTELFPAIKVPRIFDAIEAYFGIEFIIPFYSNDRFDKLFLYCKNTIKQDFLTEIKDIDFISKTNVNDLDWFSYTTKTAYQYVDLVNNKIIVSRFDNDISSQTIQINITSKSSAGTFYIDVFKNGLFNRTITGTTTGIAGTINIGFLNSDEEYTFKVKADAVMNLGIEITYAVQISTFDIYGAPIVTNSQSVVQSSIAILNGYVNVGKTMPDMKVADFVSGIMKEMNSNCIGIDQKTFELIPVETWYNSGAVIDITEYVDINEVQVERIPLYNTISFKYQPCESFVNKNYFKTSNSEYGNAINTYSYDGGNYEVNSPFENLLFARSIDSGGNYAILGYNLNETYQAYIPKPTLLYMYGASPTLTHNIKFYNGSSNINLTKYMIFGQDITVGGTKYSLNFGADNSIIHLETIQDGLFATYYFAYLSNLYNLKQRLTTVKTILPTSLITSLQLNDRLVIRDKRYIINDFKLDLTSGEATFTLYNDFRGVLSDEIVTVDSDGETLSKVISYRPKNDLVVVLADGLTFGDTGNTFTWAEADYGNKTVNIIVPPNLGDTPINYNYSFNYGDGTKFDYTIFQASAPK